MRKLSKLKNRHTMQNVQEGTIVVLKMVPAKVTKI